RLVVAHAGERLIHDLDTITRKDHEPKRLAMRHLGNMRKSKRIPKWKQRLDGVDDENGRQFSEHAAQYTTAVSGGGPQPASTEITSSTRRASRSRRFSSACAAAPVRYSRSPSCCRRASARRDVPTILYRSRHKSERRPRSSPSPPTAGSCR